MKAKSIDRGAALVVLVALALGPCESRAQAQAAQAEGAARALASWEQAFRELRASSPRYRIASAEIARAQARARVALADLLPHADAQGSFTHALITSQENLGAGPVTVPAQDVWGASASLGIAVVDARALHAFGAAERGVDAAELDLAAERRALVDALVDALLAAWTAERLAELHRVGLRAAEERLGLAETKHALGRGTGLDLDRARGDLERARSQVLQGDDALVRARTGLGVLLGSAQPIAAPAAGDTSGLERSAAELCTSNERVERAPAVQAAQLHLELAERAIDGLDLELLPRLSLQSQLRWDSETVYGPDATLQLSAVLSVPIWDGGARYGRRREAQAERAQASARLEQARLDAQTLSTEATRAIDVAEQSARIGLTQRELARRIDESTRLAFEQGVGTSLDLIAAAQALREAELQAVLLQAHVVRARVHAALANADCKP